jgi:hypothetical protein
MHLSCWNASVFSLYQHYFAAAALTHTVELQQQKGYKTRKGLGWPYIYNVSGICGRENTKNTVIYTVHPYGSGQHYTSFVASVYVCVCVGVLVHSNSSRRALYCAFCLPILASTSVHLSAQANTSVHPFSASASIQCICIHSVHLHPLQCICVHFSALRPLQCICLLKQTLQCIHSVHLHPLQCICVHFNASASTSVHLSAQATTQHICSYICSNTGSISFMCSWPELYILCICTIYDRIFGAFPAKNTVHTPHTYIYGPG